MNACRLHGVNIQYNPDWGSQVREEQFLGEPRCTITHAGKGTLATLKSVSHQAASTAAAGDGESLRFGRG